MRGGTYFSLPAAKRSKQEKAAQTANAKRGPWSATGSGASGICVRARAYACDKGVILPAALRAPKSTSSNHPLRFDADASPTGRGSSLHRYYHCDSDWNGNRVCDRDGDDDCRAPTYHLKRGSGVNAEARRRGEADGSHKPQPKPVVSHADPSATHAVRSGS